MAISTHPTVTKQRALRELLKTVGKNPTHPVLMEVLNRCNGDVDLAMTCFTMKPPPSWLRGSYKDKD